MSSRSCKCSAWVVVTLVGLGAAGARLSNAAEVASAEARLLPATSHVLVGIDVKSFVASPLYQKVLQQAKEKQGAGSDPLQELRQKTGLDLAQDIDRIVIGAEGEPNASTGLAVIQGRFDAARMGTFLIKEKGVTTKAVGARKLYVSPAEAPGKPQTAAVVLDAGRMLVGPLTTVEKALAGGGAAGLDPKSPLVGLVARVRPGAVLWIVVDEKVLAQASGGDAPGGFKLPPLKSLVLSTDVAPDLALHLEGDTVDAAGATNLADMLRGFSAMISMQAQQKPEMARLAQALTISSEATRVTVGLKLPYDLLESLGKSMAPSVGGPGEHGEGGAPAELSTDAPAKPSAKPSAKPRVTPASPKPKP